MKKLFMLTIASVMVIGVTAIPETQAASAIKLCKGCHNFTGLKDKVGPSLEGVFGSKAGTKKSKKYGASMKNGGWTWDEANLRTFLSDTKKGIVTLAGEGAKTKMKMKVKGKKLDAVIAYLKGL